MIQKTILVVSLFVYSFANVRADSSDELLKFFRTLRNQGTFEFSAFSPMFQYYREEGRPEREKFRAARESSEPEYYDAAFFEEYEKMALERIHKLRDEHLRKAPRYRKQP